MAQLLSKPFAAGAALLICASLLGCSQPVDKTPPVAEAPPIVTAVAAQEPVESLSTLAAAATAKPQAEEDGAADETIGTTAQNQAAEAPQAEYQPPFPDRLDLFVPPKRQGGVVFKEGGSEDAVELLGFVKLDDQQVVLSINGQVTPIYEGGSQYGIEVISIQPPKVVLQRGRQRWQASLEN